MSEPGSIGIVEKQYFTFAESPNELTLESGQKLGPITVCYETYGTLNTDHSNAILICHAVSGDSHLAGRYKEDDRKPGWWDIMVGPGKPFDTNKYFIICSNSIGGCRGTTGPASLNPNTGKPYGLDFPVITIADMVRVQRELIRHLRIEKLLAVAGGSMGGMQTLEWATLYPDMMDSALVIASTSYSGAQQIAFDAVGRNAILADHAFNNGQYYNQPEQPDRGLAVARMFAHITYLSDDTMQKKFGRTLRDKEKLGFGLGSEFAVETYLDYQGEQFVNRFDANTYLYFTKAMDYFDIADDFGSLDKAMAQVKCRVLVVSFTSDWLYPPYQSKQIVDALARQGRDVTYCNIESKYGHDAFLLPNPSLEKILSGFLAHASIQEGRKGCTVPDDSDDDDSRSDPLVHSIYQGERIDYDTIVDLVEPGSRVIDVGCGDGELLCHLVNSRNVHGLGLELSERHVVRCVRRGLSVIQGDVDEGLEQFPDQSVDYVILSMTLQVIENPKHVLQEMVRVGKKCIVSFPNFAHWRIRTQMLFSGRAPVARNLPYSWHSTPNRHVLSIKDFREFCRELGIHVEKEIAFSGERVATIWPNLRCEEALYVLSGKKNRTE